MVFETLTVRKEGAVLFKELLAPPMNLLGPELVRDLVSLIQQAEGDPAIRVLVFKSADPDYFIAHVDVTRIGEYREAAVRLVGEASLGLLFRHLSASRLVTVAQIEGRVRGAALTLAPAADFRRDSELFSEAARHSETQRRIGAAMKRGFQTRDAEMVLGRMVAELPSS